MERDVQQGTPAQPAAATQSSSMPGSVAPPQPEQVQGQTPGAEQVQDLRQPTGTTPPVAESGEQTPPSPPQPDFRAELERERQERLRIEREANQYRQAINQVQQFAQEQQQNQALQQQVQMMLAHADNLPQSEANQYLRNQVTNLLAQQRIQSQQEVQRVQVEAEQKVRAVAAAPYADHLIKSLGIPEEAREELLNLRDPDLMYQQAPVIKQRYDRWKQQEEQWKQAQQQLARSQEVSMLRQNGLGAIGGQGAGGSIQLEVSDDPDEAAMQILNWQRQREREAMSGGAR